MSGNYPPLDCGDPYSQKCVRESALPGDREVMRGRGCLPADERRGLAAEALAGW